MRGADPHLAGNLRLQKAHSNVYRKFSANNAWSSIRGYEEMKLRCMAETQELVARHLARLATAESTVALTQPLRG
jgi:hypothetical protein